VTFGVLVGLITRGATTAEILADDPALEPDPIPAALSFDSGWPQMDPKCKGDHRNSEPRMSRVWPLYTFLSAWIGSMLAARAAG
jgi:hypothetical protein